MNLSRLHHRCRRKCTMDGMGWDNQLAEPVRMSFGSVYDAFNASWLSLRGCLLRREGGVASCYELTEACRNFGISARAAANQADKMSMSEMMRETVDGRCREGYCHLIVHRIRSRPLSGSAPKPHTRTANAAALFLSLSLSLTHTHTHTHTHTQTRKHKHTDTLIVPARRGSRTSRRWP